MITFFCMLAVSYFLVGIVIRPSMRWIVIIMTGLMAYVMIFNDGHVAAGIAFLIGATARYLVFMDDPYKVRSVGTSNFWGNVGGAIIGFKVIQLLRRR